MEVLFLGTGAADTPNPLPPAFAHRFDKGMRRNSALLLNGHILIDCGPHALSSLEVAGVSPNAVTDLLVTHIHKDHIDPASVAFLAGRAPLHVWCEQHAAPVFAGIKGIRLHILQHGQTVNLGGMKVLPLYANHRVGEFPLHRPFHYLIEQHGKRMFYGCDGAWMLTDTYYRLKDAQLDLMILDATVGDYTGDMRMAEHNSIPMLRLMSASLRPWGTLKEESVVCLSHLAITLHLPHDEISRIAQKDGFLVAWDGMKIQI